MELNRRQFAIAFASASVSAASFVSKMNAIAEAMPKAPFTIMDKFGKITAETHVCKVRVFLDGVDVTNDSFEADDIAGYADCYLRDDDGKWMIDKDTGKLVFSRRYGNVLIKWK